MESRVPEELYSHRVALFVLRGWFNRNHLGILNDGFEINVGVGESEHLTSLHKIELLFRFKVLRGEREGEKRERERGGNMNEIMSLFGNEFSLKVYYLPSSFFTFLF